MIEDIRNIVQFNYMEYGSDEAKKYGWLKYMPLMELQCKHIMQVSANTQRVFDAAEKAFQAHGIPNRIIWGSHRGGTKESETAIIRKMAEDNFNRPARIVIDQYGRAWADNTHTVISWIMRKGPACMLSSIPFYAVVLDTVPAIISVNGSVNDSVKEIKTAIACSDRIGRLIQCGYREKDQFWRISDLIEDIGLDPYSDRNFK